MNNNNMKKNRLGKTLLGITLSLSLLAPGSLVLNTAPAHAASISTSTASNIIETGKRFMGVRYQFGASSGRTDAFDCSSFTQYAFKQNGVNLPRSSRQQSQAGTYVSRDQLQPGDLVFFYSPIHHVAIYMGNGKIMHTYGKPGVTISDLNSGWWNSHYTTARRVLPGGSAAPSNLQPQPQPAVSNTSSPEPAYSKTSHKTSHYKTHRTSRSSDENRTSRSSNENNEE